MASLRTRNKHFCLSCQFLSGITVFLGGHSKPFSLKLPVLKFVSLKSPDELFDFNSSLGIFRVALLFICQGTSKAELCANQFRKLASLKLILCKGLSCDSTQRASFTCELTLHLLSFFATAYSKYHIAITLSTTFFIFLKSF